MATIYIPAALRSLTGGETKVAVAGATLREVIERLDEAHPGIRERLVAGDRLAPGLAAFVDGTLVTAGLRTKVGAESEVHFAPAIGGGHDAGGRSGSEAR